MEKIILYANDYKTKALVVADAEEAASGIKHRINPSKTSFLDTGVRAAVNALCQTLKVGEIREDLIFNDETNTKPYTANMPDVKVWDGKSWQPLQGACSTKDCAVLKMFQRFLKTAYAQPESVHGANLIVGEPASPKAKFLVLKSPAPSS